MKNTFKPKNLYTLDEIFNQIKSNDYNAEMLLQHLLVQCEKQLEKENELFEKCNNLIDEVCSLREEKTKMIEEKTETLNGYSKHVDMLVRERDEARRECVSFRDYYEEGNLLPWEEGSK